MPEDDRHDIRTPDQIRDEESRRVGFFSRRLGIICLIIAAIIVITYIGFNIDHYQQMQQQEQSGGQSNAQAR